MTSSLIAVDLGSASFSACRLSSSGETLDAIAVATLRKWIAEVGSKTAYIEPGSPWENGYCESFNGKVRDEQLRRSADADRGLANPLKHHATAQLAWLPTAGALVPQL